MSGKALTDESTKVCLALTVHRTPHTAHPTRKLICCTAGVCKADNKLVAIKEICFSDIKMIEEIKVEIALLQCMHASPQLHATH